MKVGPTTVSLTINLPSNLIQFLDASIENGSYPARSGAVSDALQRWRLAELQKSYNQAFGELESVRDVVATDGLSDDAEDQRP